MEHFHCVTVLAAARDLLTNSIEISQYRRSQGLDKQGFEFIVRFFLFICHNLRKGLLAAQTILISMPLSIPYLPCSQSISVDFKGIISKIPNFQFFFCKKNILLMPSFVLIHLPQKSLTHILFHGRFSREQVIKWQSAFSNRGRLVWQRNWQWRKTFYSVFSRTKITRRANKITYYILRLTESLQLVW